jgi:hypothetical protein
MVDLVNYFSLVLLLPFFKYDLIHWSSVNSVPYQFPLGYQLAIPNPDDHMISLQGARVGNRDSGPRLS